MILLTPHPHDKQLTAIERAARKVSNWRAAYRKQAGNPYRTEEVNRMKFAKSGILLRRIEQQHYELLNYEI